MRNLCLRLNGTFAGATGSRRCSTVWGSSSLLSSSLLLCSCWSCWWYCPGTRGRCSTVGGQNEIFCQSEVLFPLVHACYKNLRHRSKHNPIIWAWRNRAKLNFFSDIHWLNDIKLLIALFSIGAIWWLEKATVHIAYRLGHTCQKMLKT